MTNHSNINGTNDTVESLRIKIMDNFYLGDDNQISDGSLQELRQTNSKLSYQRHVLSRSLTEQDSTSKISLDVIACIKYLFYQSIRKNGFQCDDANNLLIQPSTLKTSDFQCNDAFKIHKQRKDMTVEQISQAIIDGIPENDVIGSLWITGPGFINLSLKKQFYLHFICDIILNENHTDSRNNPIKPPGFTKRHVLVDFSSPNIAKEMHVGHLRSTIIGDTICRLYEYLKCDVSRINHIGDWGTQFGMLIAYVEHKFGSITSPPSSISELQTFYKESKMLFDSDEEFKKKAYSMVVKLQAHDPDVMNVWKIICATSRKEFSRIYDYLDINLTEMGESFYQNLMVSVVQELSEKGLLVANDNCKIIPMDELGLPPLFVVKSDGGFTYDTSDLAALKYRLLDMNAESVLYVVDNGQSDHFKAIFHAASLAGWFTKGSIYPRIEHIGFGVVLGEDKKKFKTRSGDTVKLIDLLNEGVSRAKKKLLPRGNSLDWSEREIQSNAEKLAFSCIKYADLCHNRTSDYVFSFDKMLEDRGNTAFYLCYAYTRIKSIIRKSNLTDKEIVDYVSECVEKCVKNSAINEEPSSMGATIFNDNVPLELDHPSDIALAKHLVKYPIVIKRMAAELLPNQLCDYIYELATIFMDFYEKCYCFTTDKETKKILDINMNRIALVHATGKVFCSGFSLLGLSTTIERM